MACAYPVDGAAGQLATGLVDALGASAWSQRDIWYSTLVHFAGPISEPAALVDWVGQRRGLDLGHVCAGELVLARWPSAGGRPALTPLATWRLGTGG